ncbi:hypothetical protein V6N13_035767 [Hibiscus sabdariffa]
MPKTKGEAAAKSDDLEIVSIGYLYKGPWEKKYWSSSRGKDRYPYPVGYEAVRVHNGNTYKTEIHEGPKGPLFVVSCDGQSCSGQTPDIAWEKFQKIGCPHLKIWHGKRFLCKIDGVEFFGFKNPFVQRLLRELVATVNGTAERSLLPSSFCNGASRIENENGSSTLCTAPDLLPYLARPQIRKKRNTSCEIMQSKLAERPCLKRPRSEELGYGARRSNLVKGNKVKDEHGFSATQNASKDENDKILEASVVHLKSVGKDVENSPAIDGFTLKSVDFLGDHGENEAKSKFIGSQDAKSTRLANIACEELVRSQGNVLEGFSFPIKTDDRPGDSSVPNDSMDINDVHLYAPDTLDFEVISHSIYADDRTDVASGPRDTNSSMKEESTAADIVISDGMVAESHQEKEIGTSNSNAGSEKSDFDSVGHDLVTESHQEEEIGTSNSNTGSEKSDFDSVGQEMMTVLLPQAVPLLKKSSKKKKETSSPCKVLPHVVNSREDNIEANHLLNLPTSAIILTEDARAEQDTRMHIQGLDHGLVVPNFEHLNSVILDSFEDGQGGDHVDSQAVLFSKHMVVDQTSFNKDAFHFNIQEQHVSVNLKQETTVYCGNQDTICHKEVNMALNQEHLKSDVSKSESVLGCMPPIMTALAEDFQGVSVNLDKNSADVRNHSVEKKPENAFTCAEVGDTNDNNSRGIATPLKLSVKDSRAETRVPDPKSSHQTQNKVYTRKKVSKQACSTRKYIAPLSESIVCRNSGVDYAPNKSAMTGASPVSKSCHSSDGKACNRDIFDNTPMHGQSYGLPEEKTTTNCKPEISNMPPILSNEDQKLTGVSKAKDASCLLDPPASLERGFQENCHKERLEHRNTVEKGSSPLCQNQVTSFCDKNLSIQMEVQGSLDVNHYRDAELTSDLKGIINLVGVYFHPSPILSVLLGTKGNEIHICVSCGLLVDRDRTLFIYKVATEEERKGCPSFVGYTSVALPSSEIDVERRGLQLTPDGQNLVLLDSIKTPYCSAWTEEFIIPAGDSISCVVELKKIPKCPHLVIGHNGFGDFVLWDIRKRINISRFSGSGTPIKQFLPISLLSWQPVFGNADTKWCIDEIMTATKLGFSGHKDCSFLPLEEEDVAIWLLVSDAQYEHLSSNCQANMSGWWRLALLVKDRIILGGTLDPSNLVTALLILNMRRHFAYAAVMWATAIGAAFDHGIMGRDDGLVYMWELSTGARLDVLHHFKGGSVSCIASNDGSSPKVVAVAADDGLVFSKGLNKVGCFKFEGIASSLLGPRRLRPSLLSTTMRTVVTALRKRHLNYRDNSDQIHRGGGDDQNQLLTDHLNIVRYSDGVKIELGKLASITCCAVASITGFETVLNIGFITVLDYYSRLRYKESWLGEAYPGTELRLNYGQS